MTTFTICYSGTDCYLDQALVLRKPKELASYNTYSGYVPSKIYYRLAALNKGYALSTTLNGCGGPYNEDRDTLPIRVWSIETVTDEYSTTYYTECHLPPKDAIDSLSGQSVELIAIAGIAKMFDVTFHLVPTGNLDQIKEYWDDTKALEFTQEDLAYPLNNSRWNNTMQSTAGHYCIRWNEQDDKKINAFLLAYDSVALVGHSRGGVACLIASNYLAEWFASLNIKIIALDPVPGTGDWWDCITQIPAMPNLEYIGIYAIDETSSGFNGVVPKIKGISQTTGEIKYWDPLNPNSDGADFAGWNTAQYELIYTRGRHATVPGSCSRWGKGEGDPPDLNVGASGNLACAYSVKRLRDWNVPLEECDSASVKKWIILMNSASTHFKDMRNMNYGPANALGMINGFVFYKARGISSDSGRNSSQWNYLEAFIPYARSDANGLSADALNAQRGLIDLGVREKYYSKLGGTGKVHPWTYLGDKMTAYAPRVSSL